MTRRDEEDVLTLLICTANLGNAKPTLKDLAAWIPAKGSSASVTPLYGVAINKERFDLVAVGMQESTWSGTRKESQNLDDKSLDEEGIAEEDEAALAEKAKEDSHQLEDMIESTLGSGYVCKADQARGQMRLLIFARTEIADGISDLVIKCENTGIAHVMANKGGIVISLTYEKTRISFLSAHLAAHEGDKYYEARLYNLWEILNGARTHERYDVSISSHHMFIMGDLNFRCRFPEAKEKADSVKAALELIKKEDWKTLYSHDELHKGIEKGELLVDFKTLPCYFNPTFKVQREAGFVYKEQRTPSYTDRILFRSEVRDALKPLAYEPCAGFTTSDHKPVRGAFLLTTNAALDRNAPGDKTPCSYTIKFHDMVCKDLPVMDVTGTSDPYVMFCWYNAQIATDHGNKGVMMWTNPGSREFPKTKFIKRTLNPNFKGETMSLAFNGPVSAESMLYLTLMDYDFTSQDDLMGSLPINLRELVAKVPVGEKKTRLSWVRPLSKNGKHFGTIRLKIDIIKSKEPLVLEMGKKPSAIKVLVKMFGCSS